MKFYIKKLDERHQAIRKWGEEQRKHLYHLK
ncbi:hypothetical protein REG_0126 [Candidatus Regiella insecticola LSR1]|uniref:Uncharacterized protein n=1 Tax=Candidatus Regiella insecticola LSR1 TaxID=663321 RepID=E0WQG2_9ENTR|nr:hypothetical protein REG_0126 [Candidatus Regiella insecticola LSR1]